MPWRELAGFRNVIVHGYLGIDLTAVWLVIEQDLPPLAAALDRTRCRLRLKQTLSVTLSLPPRGEHAEARIARRGWAEVPHFTNTPT